MKRVSILAFICLLNAPGAWAQNSQSVTGPATQTQKSAAPPFGTTSGLGTTSGPASAASGFSALDNGPIDYEKLPHIVVMVAIMASLAGSEQSCHPPVATDIHNCAVAILKNYHNLSPGQPPITDDQMGALEKLWKARFSDAYQKQSSANPPATCDDVTKLVQTNGMWGVCYGTPPDPVTGQFSTPGGAPAASAPAANTPSANAPDNDGSDGQSVKLQ